MKYIKIKQKPYCCVGACIEMILKRNNIINFEQLFIAKSLGLIIPFGTQIEKEEYSLNSFFKKNNINLTSEYYYINNKEEIKEFLIKNSDKDIMICFKYTIFYSSDKDEFGHMVLFNSLEEDTITILDPYLNQYVKKSINELTSSIVKHGVDNGAGFYLIK